MQRNTDLVQHACATTLFFILAFTTFGFGQTYTVIHSFSGSDGEFPYSGLIRGTDGNFYGTTFAGGAIGAGTVFKMTPAGKVTVVYSFAGGTDGEFPQSSLLRDAAGNIYGTTPSGGASNAGTAFKINSAGREAVLYSFTGGADGGNPTAGLVRDLKGNLYGVTNGGGDAACNTFSTGCGTVFKISPRGVETVVHTFEGGLDGEGPFGGLAIDTTGNLYGTTESAGASGAGTLFKIDTSGTETVLYAFQPGIGFDGNSPRTDLVFGPGGTLYGSTFGGGDESVCQPFGCGAIFQLNTQNVESTLYSFEGQPSDGAIPSGPIARDSAGNLYGVTESGGANGFGTVFKLDPSNHETVLYSFTGGTDGGAPNGRLYVTGNGTVFGAAPVGGTSGMGVAFRINP